MSADLLRRHARAIWDAAVAAVHPEALVREAVTAPDSPLARALATARRIIVVGGGKAGAAMCAGLEEALADRLDRITGVVNVPAEAVRPLRAIRLHAARPAGSNEPTAAGVEGVRQILELAESAGPEDVVICLLSGGGSALLPAPPDGITLDDKQAVTRLLHASGATINEMNAVRKHLSRFKGGGLARASAAGQLYCLIISDVVGDPLDVIASGPAAPDPTTYADALAILRRYQLLDRVPADVRRYLERGAAGELPETLKEPPPHVHNLILGNNARALAAARARAEAIGYRVLNLGAFIEGETRSVAGVLGGVVRGIAADGQPLAPPACVLVGGETTVTLTARHGKGGRNTEFVLAALIDLEKAALHNYVVLSGGTDGEDGPTDAAGAIGDWDTLGRARADLGLDPSASLDHHDSYSFFDATGDLLRTGLTNTNVMDVRVLLVGPE
jgi:hydroxypyruvate reductase/glycerate 2-kinase